MDLLEPDVQVCQSLGNSSLLDLPQGLRVADPVADQDRDLRPAGGCIPAGNGSMSCSRNEPGRSLAVACGCGATSQTGVIASEWIWRTSAR